MSGPRLPQTFGGRHSTARHRSAPTVPPVAAARPVRVELLPRLRGQAGRDLANGTAAAGVPLAGHHRKRGPKPGRRFPLAPLVAVLEAEAGHSLTARQIADAIGLPASHGWTTVQRWKTTGLTVPAADSAAIGMGSHPALIWPEWLDA